MEQPQYNLLYRDKVEGEYHPLYENYGMGTTIWSPLASGLLTGKYLEGIPNGSRLALPGYEWLRKMWATDDGKQKIEKIRKLAVLAADLGVSLTHLSIAWCLKNPQVSTVILGASKLSQLEDNLKSIEVLPLLTDSVMASIDAIVDNRPAGIDRF